MNHTANTTLLSAATVLLAFTLSGCVTQGSSPTSDADVCLPGPIEIDPPQAAAGSTITITGTAADCNITFTDDGELTLDLVSSDSAAQSQTKTVEASKDGAFIADVPLPVDWPNGEYTVTISDGYANPCDTSPNSCAIVSTTAVINAGT